VVVKSVKAKLKAAKLLNTKRSNPHQFYVSDFTKSFEETTRLFYKEKIKLEYCPIW